MVSKGLEMCHPLNENFFDYLTINQLIKIGDSSITGTTISSTTQRKVRVS